MEKFDNLNKFMEENIENLKGDKDLLTDDIVREIYALVKTQTKNVDYIQDCTLFLTTVAITDNLWDRKEKWTDFALRETQKLLAELNEKARQDLENRRDYAELYGR